MKIKKIMKSLSVCTLVLCMLLSVSVKVSAASSASWKINYKPGAPSDVSNQVEDLYVSYYSGGYVADCKTISGANGRQLTITAKNAGGINAVPITTTGTTKVFKTKESVVGNVRFQVTAKTGYKCDSTGVIKTSK